MLGKTPLKIWGKEPELLEGVWRPQSLPATAAFDKADADAVTEVVWVDDATGLKLQPPPDTPPDEVFVKEVFWKSPLMKW